jgi:hypothetical protein
MAPGPGPQIVTVYPEDMMVEKKPKKKPAPSPFFRWAAGSGTARKESVKRKK